MHILSATNVIFVTLLSFSHSELYIIICETQQLQARMTLKTFKINMLLRNYGMKQMSVVLRKKVTGKTERI